MLSMAASASMPHSLHCNTRPTHEASVRNFPRTSFGMAIRCQNHDGPGDPGELNKKPSMKMEEGSPPPRRILDSLEKLGNGLKDSLSPQKKGDWKDLTLMSLSFAVYVYVSQKIVCAYYAWMSMPKQRW